MNFAAKTGPRPEAQEEGGDAGEKPADGHGEQPALHESHVTHPHGEHLHSEHHPAHHEHHEAHAAAHPRILTPEERARRKRLLDRIVYGLATAALVILGVFFRDDLGVLFAPLLGIIILLIIYDIRDLAVRTDRLVLLVVLFLLF